ncbi:hypothetical protein [Hoyosella subflava]|uniref:Secreted protein n=1 Tax=Hoyosella subflava (strain DSM 45089 / JCM 17490 / NBRC 109087 / DQS3-9A1) TaxID=443218 RepID=F6ELZ5_HOYSD|nr:hypothetical protein [Hoyosella subflava]AEF42776.1 hypothetical protein AS9A_4343 [Hoyosella subflava DQS3-9A1]
MPTTKTITRSAFAISAAAAAAIAVPAIAGAAPFDNQPTVVLCESGIAGVQSVVNTDNDAVPAEHIFYVINEQGGDGANVGWLNIDSFQFGTQPLVPTEFLADNVFVPLALAETGPGMVISAVYGIYENAAGEMCGVIPGFTTDQVP